MGGTRENKESFLKKLYETSPVILKKRRLSELLKVYHDLEKTLRGLKETSLRGAESSLKQINVRKLIRQLSLSKRKLERKIGNTILLEKQQLKKRLRAITSNLHPGESEV